MFSFLFDTTFTVSLAEYLFIALVGAAVYGLVQYTRDIMRTFGRDRGVEPAPVEPEPQMTVIPPWSQPADDPEPVPPAWRERLALESAPTFASMPLPGHKSVWRFKPWGLDDPDHTGAWPIIQGVDAMDLDMEPGQPQVDPAAQRRFERSEAEMSALAAAQGFTARERFIKDPAIAEAARLLPEKRSKRAKATVDLDANKVVIA
jgi:hypothetical protein